MKAKVAIIGLASLLALAACGPDPDRGSTASEAEDFAARINGGAPTASNAPPTTGDEPRPLVTPTVAQPLPQAAQQEFSQGRASDPAYTTCDASKMGPFIGLVADARTRIDIEDAAGPGREIRFLRPGGVFVKPDPGNPRLNIVRGLADYYGSSFTLANSDAVGWSYGT